MAYNLKVLCSKVITSATPGVYTSNGVTPAHPALPCAAVTSDGKNPTYPSLHLGDLPYSPLTFHWGISYHTLLNATPQPDGVTLLCPHLCNPTLLYPSL